MKSINLTLIPIFLTISFGIVIIIEFSRELASEYCEGCINFQIYKNNLSFLFLSHNHKNYVVVIPDFTYSAYQKNGFYDYYRDNSTNKTITVNVVSQDYYKDDEILNTFKKYGFSTITDTQINSNPMILNNYSKVIVLHNEYVTQKEFNALQNHNNVLYLYANALYAKVNYSNNKITLVKGHGFPKIFNSKNNDYEQGDMRNAFNWKYDINRFYELNQNCGFKFLKTSNGFESVCFPITLKDFKQVNIWKYILK